MVRLRKFFQSIKKNIKQKAKKSQTLMWSGLSLILLLMLGTYLPVAFADDATITTPQTFASLDGSVEDDDGVVNGIFTVNGNLNLTGTGAITCINVCPIKINVSGNMSLASGTSISAENTGAGSGGKIEISVGGDIALQNGAKISSARTTTTGSGNGGDLTITAGGGIDFDPGSIVSAANAGGGKAGDISISSEDPMTLDGLISSGPSNTVLASKLTGAVLSGGNTTQRGGKITISCTSTQSPGVTVSTDGVIVSQGEDPASDTITISGCGVNIYGLVASVAKKSNGSPGNSPQVIVKSSGNVLVNGTNLGSAGANQGKIRADYITGEQQIPNKIDIFASGNISILGPSTGTIYTLSSNGGSATNQRGGTISIISTDSTVQLSGLAAQASGPTSGGGRGGAINIDAKLDVDLSNAGIIARGATTGGDPDGGDVRIRSYSQNIVTNAGSSINVTGGAPTPEGTVNLTACGTIGFPPGTVTPVTANKTAGVCAPSAPSLPQGVSLPVCVEDSPTPTPTEVTPTPTEITPTPTEVTPTPTEVTPTPTEVTPTPTEITPTPSDEPCQENCEEITPTPTEVTPTPTEATPTPSDTATPSATPTPTTSNDNPGGGGQGSSTTSTPTQAVLGTTTLAYTGGFELVLSKIALISGILMTSIGMYGQKRKSNKSK